MYSRRECVFSLNCCILVCLAPNGHEGELAGLVGASVIVVSCLAPVLYRPPVGSLLAKEQYRCDRCACHHWENSLHDFKYEQ